MTSVDPDPDLRHRLDALADLVQSELAAAGLPVIPESHPTGTAGAIVSVDRPELRGVSVDWRTNAVLADAAQEAWGDDPHAEGEEVAAFSRLNSAIYGAMSDAMRTILTAAGLEVGDGDSEHELLVTRRLAPSPWRARRDAQFTRRYESMQAAWNERNTANCPQDDCEVHGKKSER